MPDAGFHRRDALVKGIEDGVLQPLACQFREAALDGVRPRRRGRREVDCPVGMVREPGMDTGRPAGREAVENDMDPGVRIEALRDMVEEGTEVLGPGPSSAPPPCRSRHRGRPAGWWCRSACSHASGWPGARRQGLLCPPQGPDPVRALTRAGGVHALTLVNREHDGMIRRVRVGSDDIMGLDAEAGGVRDLEGPDLMGPQAMALQDPAHGGGRQAPSRCGQGLEGPVAPVGRRRRHGRINDGLDRGRGDRLSARRPGNGIPRSTLKCNT